MSVLATDNFNRADNADLGATWDVVTGEGAFKVATNAAAPTTLTSDAAESNNSVTWPDDQYSQGVVPVVDTNTTIGTGTGVLVRTATGARTYYRCIVDKGGSEIAKQVSGSYTQLATNPTVWNNGDTVYLSAIGTALQVKRNGSDLFSTVDGATASGRAGVNFSAVGSAGTNLDDWEGGDFASARRFLLVR